MSRGLSTLSNITKSRPGVPTVLESICVVILLSLSLSVLTVTQSVRPSLSQLARFGLVTQSSENTRNISPAVFFTTSFIPSPCSSMFLSVLFVSARRIWKFIKYFSSLYFPVSELPRSRQGRGEKRGEGGGRWPLNQFDKRPALPFIIYLSQSKYSLDQITGGLEWKIFIGLQLIKNY